MSTWEIETWNYLDIDLRGKTSGKGQSTCPHCSASRRKKKEKCLSWDLDTGLYNCSHCGEKGKIHKYKMMDDDDLYVKPEWTNITGMDDRVVKYWNEQRGIKQSTLIDLDIKTRVEGMPVKDPEGGVKFQDRMCTLFPYKLNGEVINIKFRDGQKNFKMHKGSKLIAINLDSLKGEKKGYIVEGEVDMMSLHQIGKTAVISVPNGATVSQSEIEEYNNTGDIKEIGSMNLQWLDNSIVHMEHIDEWVIATDNDAAGYKLGKELVRRLGSEKCSIVDWGDCKDANEVLTTHDEIELEKRLNAAKQVPVNGVIMLNASLKSEMIHNYKHGKPMGFTTEWIEVDKVFRWRYAEVNYWSGYNNEGKSTWLLQSLMALSVKQGIKHGLFHPENMPAYDIYDELIEMFIGKDVDQESVNRMTLEEYLDGMEFVRNHFFIVYPDNYHELPSWDWIHGKMEYLIKHYGIRTVNIDTWGSVAHDVQGGETFDLYVSRSVGRQKAMALRYDVIYNVVAHQKAPKLGKDDVDFPPPSLYNIKGGGSISDRCDNVIMYWRPYRRSAPRSTAVTLISEKIKKQKLVAKTGSVDGYYDVKTNRFYFGEFNPMSGFKPIENLQNEFVFEAVPSAEDLEDLPF